MVTSHQQLVSLWDMLRFYASSYAAAMSKLAQVQALIVAANEFELQENENIDRALIKATINEVKPHFDELPLSRSLKSQLDRFSQKIDDGKPSHLAVVMLEIHQNLTVELTEPYFLMIPAADRKFYEGPELLFGPLVDQVFPDASRDISAAGRCRALDEWTACVFHLMRALEHGLRQMADNVGLPLKSTGLENWKNLIDQIERKIKEMESLPKNVAKSDRIKALSGCAVQFRYFKDAWRNHVSHSRVTYDEREAISIYTHVNDFIHQLAELLESGCATSPSPQ